MNNLIKIHIQQPALPKYRIPVFRALATLPGIRIKVFFSEVANLKNCEPEEFDASYIPASSFRILGRTFFRYTDRSIWRAFFDADILVLCWNPHYIDMIQAILISKIKGIPVVLWGHGYSKASTFPSKIARKALALTADALMFYNNRAAQEFGEANNCLDKTFVALNSLNQEPIQQAQVKWLSDVNSIDAFAKNQGLEGRRMILFVSRLEADNRVDLLIEAAKELSRELEDVFVAIVGDGPDRARLEVITQELGMGGRIRFLGAMYDEADLAPWYLTAKLLCYPANIGLSILHAFGYGLPVVTSDKIESQNPEIEALEHGVNGLLYRDGDIESLVSSLRVILEDEDVRSRMSINARETISSNFTLERMVTGMYAAIEFANKRRKAR